MCKTKTKWPVIFSLSGTTLEIPDGGYLLENAQEAGIEMVYDCCEGVCGACMTYAKGPVEFATEDHCLTPEQVNNGQILT